jgi:hypothetical protein
MTRPRGEPHDKDQARPGRKLHRRWRRLLSARARHQPEAPAAALADQAPGVTAGSSRPQRDSLFEPDQPDPPPPIAAAAPAVAGPPQLARPPRPPRRTVSAWLLLAPALTLVVGAVLGFALGSTQASRQPAVVAPTSSPSPTTQLVAPPSTKVVVRHYASPACLETTRRGDHMIDLLIRNRRRQAETLLVAYTVAARQCRKDTSPTP